MQHTSEAGCSVYPRVYTTLGYTSGLLPKVTLLLGVLSYTE